MCFKTFKAKFLAILTAGAAAISCFSGFTVSTGAFAVTGKTYDGKYSLTDRVSAYHLFDADNSIPDAAGYLRKAIEDACGKSLTSITFEDLQKITYLDLSALELEELPTCINYMENLRELNVSNNYLTTNRVKNIDFSGLKKLITLDASFNYFDKVPAWYLYDGIYSKTIDSNLINTDNQRVLKAKTPVYYFMTGDPLDVDQFKIRLLADICLDDNSNIPNVFLGKGRKPEEIYGEGSELFVEKWDLDKKVKDGKISISGSSDLSEATIRLFKDSTNDNTKVTVRFIILDGTNPSTVRSRLDSMVAEGAKLKKDEYTEKSWTAYDNALKSAKAISAYAAADAVMLKNAMEQLALAKDGLVEGVNSSVKTVLNALTSVGKTYKEENYTPETWEPFNDSLTQLTDLSKDKNATLNTANDAIIRFQTAQAALKPSELEVPETIKQSQFEEIFGEDMSVASKGITRSGRSYSWDFEGKDIKAPADFLPEIDDHPKENADILLDAGRAGGYIAFSTAQAKEFPGKGTLTLDVSDKFDDGTFYLYLWNSSAKKGEAVCEVKVRNGFAEIPISEGGVYYVNIVMQKFELKPDKLEIDHTAHTIIVPYKTYKAGEFKKLFDFGNYLELYDEDGKLVTNSTAKIKTGMKASSPNGETYVITVMGDVNNDGSVNAKDATFILKRLAKISKGVAKPKPPVETPEDNTENNNNNNSNNSNNTNNSNNNNNNNASGNNQTSGNNSNNNNSNNNANGSGTLGVNGNPDANKTDPTLEAIGKTVTGINVADVNGDGKISAKDASELLKKIVSAAKS